MAPSSIGYWDSLKKGLLAGEMLLSDLKRMEVAYLNQNARELEITKHVSLRELDPLALVALRETGRCEFQVPEVLFDLDFPGHYFRRIKSVGVSIPCVVGPYTSLSGTLTLLLSKLRTKSAAVQGNYNHQDNFRASYLPAQSIATSTGQNDSGMFELNFRDERYLPFEGAGVIGRWRLELPAAFRPFDYATISDAVLYLRYTARDAGGSLKQSAEGGLAQAVNAITAARGEQGFSRLFSLRHEFPTEWHRLTGGANPAVRASEKFAVTKNRFPFLVGDRDITVSSVDLYAVPKQAAETLGFHGLTVTLPGAQSSVLMTEGASIERLSARTFNASLAVAKEEANARWTFEVPAENVDTFQKAVDDILMVCHYSI